MNLSVEDRFWTKVLKTDGCWLWTGGGTRTGYGTFYIEGRMQGAHVASWKLTYGPLTDRLCVLHKCDNPKCVRPDHLFIGTYKDNTQDMIAKGRARSPGASGERNNKAVLTENQVREIRSIYGRGISMPTAIAARFGVCRSTINQIVARKIWRHL